MCVMTLPTENNFDDVVVVYFTSSSTAYANYDGQRFESLVRKFKKLFCSRSKASFCVIKFENPEKLVAEKNLFP